VDALDELIRLCVELDRRRRDPGHGDGRSSGGRAARPGTFQAWEALERAVIGKTIDLLLCS
jgi:hypothetical protein